MTTANPWAERYVADLQAAAAALPPDRRAELVAEVEDHLRYAMPGPVTDEQAREILDRLGDPHDLAAAAAADLAPSATTSGSASTPAAQPAAAYGSASEIIALLLMGLGGLALPLLAPAVGVMLMPSTPRWTPRQVRTTGLILGIGGLALVAGLVLLALADPASPAAVRGGLLLLGVVFLVGPASALYAATRPRPVG